MKNSNPWLVHAEALLEMRHLAAALASFDVAERKGADAADCAAGRWMIWMLQGKFDEAWRESDSIRRRGAPDPHRFWNGEPQRGKRVMVRCLHGFGDAVQFLRYLPALQSIAARVIVEAAPRMVELTRLVDGVDEVISWGERKPAVQPAWDAQIEITELPYYFRTRLGDLPIAADYIRIPPEVCRAAAKSFGRDHRVRVGVVWSAGEWNPTRSMPLYNVQRFMEHADFTFWNLQGGSARSGWNEIRSSDRLRDEPAFCGDRGIVPLAAFTSQLDLVISVDTLAAHLAGALGRPVWLMLQKRADWRWMVERDDSPWYPSMRIFRQAEQGDWDSVSDQIEQALAEWHKINRTRVAA
jgi:hypothetical protein